LHRHLDLGLVGRLPAVEAVDNDADVDIFQQKPKQSPKLLFEITGYR